MKMILQIKRYYDVIFQRVVCWSRFSRTEIKGLTV